MNSVFRTLCSIHRPALLIEYAQEVAAKHPLEDLCDTPQCLRGYSKPIVLYGAGRFAKSVIAAWQHLGVRPDWCVDSNPDLHGTTLLDIPIRSPEELRQLGDSVIVIIATMHTSQIQRWLHAHRLPHVFAELDGNIGCLPGNNLMTRLSDFERVWDMLHDSLSRQVLMAAVKARLFQNIWIDMIGSPFLHALAVGSQYVVHDLFSYDDQRVYVDCGAYDGDFLVSLARVRCETGIGALRAHAFEADVVNVSRLQDTLHTYELEDVTIHHALVGKEDILLDAPDFNNCRQENPSSPVRMVRLDSVLRQTDVGFIKMDIEGGEIDGLLGAQQIVSERRPRLAVCAYHTTAHLLDVPLALSDMFPHYEVYVRHHSINTLWETVCYARPN